MNINKTPKIIAVSGNIGVGKTTLIKLLAEEFSWQSIPEPNETNPYLEQFYQESKRIWAFRSQSYFLNKRLSLYINAMKQDSYYIQDRTFFEDAEVFTENLYNSELMNQDDYSTYRIGYINILEFIPAPMLIIYLFASVDTLMRRISERASPGEKISKAYIRELNQYYENWSTNFDFCPIMRINTNSMNEIELSNYVATKLQNNPYGFSK